VFQCFQSPALKTDQERRTGAPVGLVWVSSIVGRVGKGVPRCVGVFERNLAVEARPPR
jgi:hypothetical protein